MKEKDTTLTPLDLINKLGYFDLDPCGYLNHQTAGTLNVWPNDGLKLNWIGRIWLNPPYSNPAPWLEKLSNHNNGIALVLCSTETNWFQDFVFKTASSILFMKGRPKFLKVLEDGKFKQIGLMRATCLIGYGENNTEYLLNSNINGKLVYLK